MFIVHHGLPNLTWGYTHGKEVVTLLHFLNTNSSCAHKHTEKFIHTRDYTHTYTHCPCSSHVHSPSKEEVVFSFLISHTQTLCFIQSLSNHKNNTLTHTHRLKHTFSHANPSFFSLTLMPTFTVSLYIHLHSKIDTNTHSDKHTQPKPFQPRTLTLTLSESYTV